MFIRDQEFPPSTGTLVTAGIAGLLAKGWSSTGLTVRGKKPAGTTADPLTRRMVAIRDDSGPIVGRVSRRRQGVRVWADSSVDAENICHDLMAVFGAMADGNPIARTHSFTGPFDVTDDVPLIVASKPLTEFYFTFIADVKGSKPA